MDARRDFRLRGGAGFASGFLYAHLQRAVNPTPFGLNHGIEFCSWRWWAGCRMCGARCSARTILTVLQDYLATLLPKLLGENGNFEVIGLRHSDGAVAAIRAAGVWPFVARSFPAGLRAHLLDHADPLPKRSKPTAGESLLIGEQARASSSGGLGRGERRQLGGKGQGSSA